MHKLLRSFAIVAVALNVEAARFNVVHAGKDVHDARVCLFPAGEGAAPLTRFFKSAEVMCFAASDDVTIPPGRWNVYATTDTMVSERVVLVTADDTRNKRTTLEVIAGATLEVANRADGESAFVWVPGTRSAIPLEGNLVPATSVVPLTVKDGVIVRIAPSVTLAAGETRRIEMTAPRAGKVDAVVPVTIRGDAERQPPVVVIADAAGAKHKPLAAMDADAGETLLFFREVPRGKLTATLDGERWKHAEVAHEAAAAMSVAIFEKPLEGIPTSKLSVHWWSTRDLARLAGRDSCEPATGEPEKFTATLMSCPDPKKEWSHSSQCKDVETRELPLGELSGDLVFEDAPVGPLRVRFNYPRLPALDKEIITKADEPNKLDAELRWFTFFGTVTRGGKPVEAEVFGTVSDPETGRYDAALPRVWREGVPWTVKTCDGSVEYMIVPDEVPVENTRYDVEIDDNRVIVDVIDAATRQPIAAAQVSLGAAMNDDEDGVHFGGPAGTTDEKGRLVIEPVLSNKRLHICASHDDYHTTCADRFTMGVLHEKALELALTKADLRRGRIVAPSPFRFGRLVWYDSVKSTEHIRLRGEEPVFTYRQPHAEGETVVFTADNQPLYAFRYPRLAPEQEFIVQIPNVRRRTFTVTLSEASREEGGFVALQIGQLVVPINMVGWHGQFRRLQSSLRPGQTITIPDVAETGPITVIFVPFRAMKPYEGRSPMPEFPLVPEFASFPRQLLGERDAIVFE